MAPYQYKPLNLPHETRILTSLPGQFDDPLTCSLAPMPFSLPPASYTRRSVTAGARGFVGYKEGEGLSESAEMPFRDLLDHPYYGTHYIAQGGMLPAGIVNI
ncbi:hypothetical protein SODALDRAFT_334046 [Sodiomyces alkalinus F11]|uniref:Uncharacterized protein n=1 Tax=Sodiomyces alkalinus (strain CBS 110278 / VKM F-3762 / F11) TaxID=1314773 RepID=A0A3N2PUV9_SODAK|nr:hypothetical protein SODALDRAFT_334046 [Sodiomyces alkalinus F11]ROT38282.1 hypothetical protein SODALDRAFT_334046 [Sodiomyces alkalinus F11]